MAQNVVGFYGKTAIDRADLDVRYRTRVARRTARVKSWEGNNAQNYEDNISDIDSECSAAESDDSDNTNNVRCRGHQRGRGTKGRGAKGRGTTKGNRTTKGHGVKRRSTKGSRGKGGGKGCGAGNSSKGKEEKSVETPVEDSSKGMKRKSVETPIEDSSKGKKIKSVETPVEDPAWPQDPTPPVQIPFTAQPDLQVNPHPKGWLAYLQLFITREILVFLTEETNMYAEYCKSTNKPGCKGKWTPCSLTEMARYLGLRILMGIFKLPTERMYWQRDDIFGNSTFPKTMSYPRYVQIHKYLHSFNPWARPKNNTDKTLLVRPILDFIRKRCHEVYIPEKELSLDEGLLAYKGRLSIKTYNLKKHSKYGIQFYMLCEAKTGYVLDFIVYRGQGNKLKQTVKTLLKRYFHKGYRVFMDNFYNSVDLTEELYALGIHTTGTLRLFKSGPPLILKNLRGKKMKRDTLNYRRKGNTFIICWYDTRLVPMITNLVGPQTEKVTVIR